MYNKRYISMFLLQQLKGKGIEKYNSKKITNYPHYTNNKIIFNFIRYDILSL